MLNQDLVCEVFDQIFDTLGNLGAGSIPLGSELIFAAGVQNTTASCPIHGRHCVIADGAVVGVISQRTVEITGAGGVSGIAVENDCKLLTSDVIISAEVPSG